MSRTLTVRRKVLLPPQHLLQLLMDPEFIVARQEIQGALKAHVTEVARDGQRVVQEVTGEYHARTILGVDRTRTERAVTTHEWDLVARRGRWVYRGPHGDRIRIEGTFEVLPEGSDSTFRADFEVTARIPLLGSRIEQRVMDEIERDQPRFNALLDEFARRAASAS